MPTIDTRIAECPLCGHEALFLEDYENKEIVVLCPDRYCPNCQDRLDT
ncbi:MAG: hypothetical protein RDU76_02865 [Candidatus Edwardsbacteria bacterium]|nr:hypothetical protein [Candidatus Edwardsbacteria bacterium]